MTPRISLITAVVAAALVVGVPSAFGDNWGADRQAATEHAAMLDARERSLATPRNGVTAPVAVGERPYVGDGGDRFTIDPTSTPVTIASSHSRREIEWPQIGLGALFGVALALGLMFVLRTARSRELAH